MPKKVRILIVDDHPMMRAGLSATIADDPSLEVCGEADGVNSALSLIQAARPDLAIIDIALKQGHGIDLVKDVKTRYPNIKMLVLSTYQESLYGERALRAGAMGYLNKQQAGENLFDAIHAILAGRRYLSKELTMRLVGRAIDAADAGGGELTSRLSDRELQVFRLIGEGLGSGAIARQLHLSPHTIDTHREKIKAKLNIRTAAQLQREATQWMLENG
jgi:DNA-binding NarL/FixJ family response regulator